MDWELAPPTWEAVATMFAGAAAVAGATVVGMRQASIQREQVDIARQQMGIQESLAQIEFLKVKMELFEMRRSIYEKTKAFLIAILADGRSPLDRRDLDGEAGERAKALADDFVGSIDASRFLFRDGVNQDLNRILKLAYEFDYFDRRMQVERHFPVEREIAATNREHHFNQFQTILAHLSTIFGEELFLGSRTGSPGTLTDDGHQA